MQLISFTDKGFYCSVGDFYIDPWKPVERAVITHGHADHAYAGHKYYLCHTLTKPILQWRNGEAFYQTLEWNEKINIHGITLSLHPAGHIAGSSQVRLQHGGEVWVVSGDYKIENDGISGQFQPLLCHTFITESTFGLPIYKWKPQRQIFDEMTAWIGDNQKMGKSTVMIGYSLGKAQRLVQALLPTALPIYAHGAICNMQQVLIDAGLPLAPVLPVTLSLPKESLHKAVILAPPSAAKTSWMRRFEPYAVGVCSGWMQVRGHARRQNVDAGFALSDHADWQGLLQTVRATGAEKIFVTHGFQSAFSRYCNEKNIALAMEVKTMFGNGVDETSDGNN